MYGTRKVGRQLRREGIEVTWCTVERLMRELGHCQGSGQAQEAVYQPVPPQHGPPVQIRGQVAGVHPDRRQ